MRYQFGEHELDPQAYVLRRAGAEIALQPKMLELLRYLIERRERVVSKEELLDALWPGEHVNDAAVAWTVSHVRTALGQDRGAKQPIETIHGRGYRFRAEVRTVDANAASPTLPPRSATAAVSASVPPPRRSAHPFVGRADVMARLESLLRDAFDGRGKLCLLCGEAGIGKTRCAEELVARAEALGATSWLGRAVEDAGAPVLWPWLQIVRKVAQDRPTQRAACEAILQRLAALSSAAADDAGAEGRAVAGRFHLMDELTQLLVRASTEAPVVLFIDDLQWADNGTLDVLAFLALELPSSRIFVIATHRSLTGIDPRLSRILRSAERIDLAHLTPSDIARYIAETVEAQEAPEPLARAVHNATSGNPLLVQETVRALVAEHGSAALALDALNVSPPEVARDVLRTRLSKLDESAHKLLATASVLGETFELSLLTSVSGVAQKLALEQLESAQKLGIAHAETPQRYRFAHSLMRQVLYDALPVGERVAIHRAAANVLEAQNALEPRSSEIAHHFYRSLPLGEHGRVVTAARRAAVDACSVFAFEDASRFYAWALEAQALDPAVTPRERAELLLATGVAERSAGRDADSRATLGRVFEISREHGFADLLVRGARRLRPTFAMALIPDPMLRDALEAVLAMRPEPKPQQRAAALALLACVPPYANDLKRSEQMTAEALAIAEPTGEATLILDVLRARLYSLSGPDDVDRLLETADRILQREAQQPQLLGTEAHAARAGAFMYRGDIASADRAFEAIGDIARLVAYPEMRWYYQRQVAQRRALDGQFAIAEAAAKDLRKRSKRMGLSYGPWFVDVLERHIAIARRGRDAVFTEDALASLGTGALGVPINIRARLVRLAAEMGRLDLARAGMDGIAAHGFASIPKEISYLYVLSTLAFAACILRDHARAEQLYKLLAPYAAYNTPDSMLFYEGSVSLALALLAECLGFHDRIESHFEQALAMNERMGAKPVVARTRYEYARWLARHSDPKQRARSKPMAESALALAESLGMVWLVEKVRTI